MNVIATKSDVRLDQYLALELDISRSKVQKLIKEGKVFVNSKALSSNYMVKENDSIDITDSLSFDITVEKEDIPLDIVYEDDDLIVLNKPSGMVVHPAPSHYSGTLVNALLYHFDLAKGSSSFRPGIVHRIDKDTSGLLIVAKSEVAFEKLSQMIAKKEVKRIYVALVEGVIPHDTATIDAPIGRDTVNRQKMMVTDVNSKSAITHFKVLKRFSKYTLIECELDTGRTHQIRVHMSYIGYPIVNDPVYGKHKKTTDFGQLLHAKKLIFYHPITGSEMCFEVDPPEEFVKLMEELTGV